MRIMSVLVLSLLVSQALAEAKCPHEVGIYCPPVEAPRVTELKEGAVKIQYMVLPNGSVSDVEVIESSGDPRWVQALITTVQSWRYTESEKKYRQEYKLNAALGP